MQLLRNITGFGALLDWAVRFMDQRAANCPPHRSRRELSEGTTPINEDASLANAALAGHADSVEALVLRVKPEIFKVARALSGTRHDTTDLAEKIFLRIFRLLKRYPPEVPLADWSMQAAVSAGICELNSRGWVNGNPLWTENDIRLLESVDAENECFTSTEAAQLLDRMLDRLTPAERLVKRLHDLESLSFGEICRWTGWSESKVRKTAGSAKKRLDSLLVEICSTAGQRVPPV
jgi:RNA polymerase sigma factor (sigma-70 family)